MKFTWSDAWLFVVLVPILDGRELDLGRVIGHADGTNHAIPTPGS